MNATHLISANEAENTQDGYHIWHMIAAAHAASIHLLAAKLNELQGVGAKPQAGCHFAEVAMGDLTVTVEYEYEREDRQTYWEPGHPASLEILQVFLNGKWIDPRDFVSEKTLTQWEESIWESFEEANSGYQDVDHGDYLANIACESYERELDARASA
jgi:hypothetical protein